MRALALGMAACLWLEGPALADDTGDEDSPYMMEAVKVTARKKEENVQDVPMSMQVLTGDDLGRAGVDNVKEAVTLMPNVVIRNNHPENIVVIRGIVTPSSLVNNPVGFYVDDVSYSMPYMHNTDLYDVERIEVLKGPQSTLYGHNAEAGVVNIITRQPGNEFRSKASASYGEDNTWRLSGDASGPLIEDRLYLGLSVLQDYTDGYMKNVYTDENDAGKEDRLSGRGTLRWTPTDDWDFSLKINALDADDKAGLFRFETGPNRTDRGEVAYNGANSYEQDHFGQSLRVKYSGRNFELVSVTTHSDFTSDQIMDSDMASATTQDGTYKFEDKILAQELRLMSTDDGPLEWLLGLYGHIEQTDINTTTPWAGTRDTSYQGVNLAAFSQVTYTLFDSLHLNAGLRYDHLHLDGDQDYSPTAGPFQVIEKDMTFDEVLPRFGVSYDVTGDVMVYANVARGYLSGGYSHNIATSAANFMYDPEYNWNYEVGVKSTWLDKKLQANLAAFYIDMKDKQVTEWLSGSINDRKISNASKAYSRGFELEVHAWPVQGLDVFGGLGYIEARFEDWTAPLSGGGSSVYDGNNLPFVPKFTGNAGVEYHHHESGLFGRVEMNFQTAYYSNVTNTIKGDEFTVYNARFGYNKDGFAVTLWGKNIFDEVYVDQRWAWGGNYLVQDAPPRQLGVTISYSF